TYASIAARALDADLVTVCWSGRGVIRNYEGTTADVMPDLFERTIPEPPVPADFGDEPQPDAVVVLLGTNDFLGGRGAPLDVGAFDRAYVRFLARVRDVHPRSLVVVATSPMLGPDPTPWSGGRSVREV